MYPIHGSGRFFVIGTMEASSRSGVERASRETRLITSHNREKSETKGSGA